MKGYRDPSFLAESRAQYDERRRREAAVSDTKKTEAQEAESAMRYHRPTLASLSGQVTREALFKGNGRLIEVSL